METVSVKKEQQDKLYFYDLKPVVVSHKREILAGLRAKQKTISAKFFYDQTGSELFENITAQPEYYLTRSEIELLETYQAEIAQQAGEHCALIEYGSGASKKIRLLLDAIKPKAYVPMDISREFLLESAKQLRELFPWLEVHATCLDYMRDTQLPSGLPKYAKKIAFFPGSSFGNFSAEQGNDFLASVRNTVGENGALLIGLDLIKDARVFNAAYNDKNRVTQAFNLNILTHLNEMGQGSFNVENFQHHAFYNDQESRIEMQLISKIDQVLTLYGERFSFKKDEVITTEHSYKFDVTQFEQRALDAGFSLTKSWVHQENQYGLFWLSAK